MFIPFGYEDMRPIRTLGFMLLGGLFGAFPIFAEAGDSQVTSVEPGETVRVTGVLLAGVAKAPAQSDLPEGAYSYVKLDRPIDFVDSDEATHEGTYRHQRKLGVAASSTALACRVTLMTASFRQAMSLVR